jgi:hypothetical protein
VFTPLGGEAPSHAFTRQVSYMVVGDNYRGRGLMKTIQDVCVLVYAARAQHLLPSDLVTLFEQRSVQTDLQKGRSVYFLVHDAPQPFELQAAFLRANEIARELKGEPPSAIFAESNAPGVDDGVMDVAVRHRVLYKYVAIVTPAAAAHS